MAKKYKGIQYPVDLVKAEAVFGSQENALQMIGVFAETLVSEKLALESAYMQGDWGLIKNITHRIRGACLYCGAILLQDACRELECCLLGSKGKDKNKLYFETITAIIVLEDYVKHCLLTVG
jgi:HPt (histidine-containing phosphotransfer) domain-containing protein